ncbi:GNAT family acetyltransferase [Legionella lansingensis]|uniref:GNAT family acetyltransferase n=1 Tax=Legionella lansingensis TaxID=45067 RepID=A0A0W0VPV4_9GAMM|nr:GNAT family N-acetyltransferase [Legionella lansingensis]KTD22149.1 GNAT family acetyltransferase [Legionella lansingensis]SNV54514.1 GNAT family acetyltransferase [Legionella lansingensis]
MEQYLITTKQLGLRLMRQDDVKYLEGLDKDPEVKEYFPEGTLSRREIKSQIETCLANYEVKHLPCLVIFRLKDNEFVGEAYFDRIETGEIKVGYLFHKKFWSKGYATETLRGLLAWAKQHIDADYIIAYADKNNKASFRVMKKCGMEHYKDAYYLGMICRFYRIKNR